MPRARRDEAKIMSVLFIGTITVGARGDRLSKEAHIPSAVQ